MGDSNVYEVRFRSKTLQLLLSATLSDGTKLDGDRFFVNRIEVDEGLGRIPTAYVTLCSSSYDGNLRMAQLQELLGIVVCVQMNDVRPDNSIACTRWVSGVITSVRHLGVLYSPESVDGRINSGKCICGYSICIRPPLADLCLAKSNRQFVATSAFDVIATLLDSCYGGNWSIEAPSCLTTLTAKRDFSQGDVSDYAFLMRVLWTCGLTYTFVMPEPVNGQPLLPTLYIYAGVPTAEMVSPVRSDTPGMDDALTVPLYYRTMRKEGAIGCVTEWSMMRSVGVDACGVSYVDGKGERHQDEVSDGTDSPRAVRMNHVPFATLSNSPDEIQWMLKRCLGAMNRGSSTWSGVTDRLECRVGESIQLSGFYGSLDPADDIGSMLIASTHIDVKSETPDGMLAAAGDRENHLAVTLACVDISDALAVGRTVSPTLPNLSVNAQDAQSPALAVAALRQQDQGALDHAALKDLGQVNGQVQAPRVELYQATVCDSTGAVSDTNNRAGLRKLSDGTYSYEFYAKPEGTDADNRVQTVRFVQSVGGLGQGLFRVPRIGDIILVLRYQVAVGAGDGVNYLLGYLPGKTMPQRQQWDGETASPFDAMTLRFDQTENAKKDLCRTEGDVTASDGEKDLLSSLQDMGRFDTATCFRQDAQQNDFSELGFYADHTSSTEDDSSDTPQRRGALANLQSTGDIQISANDRIEVSARNIHVGCPGWNVWRKAPVTGADGKSKVDWTKVDGKIEVDDISELVVNARNRIVFQVAGSTVVIDKDGILLDSKRWPWADSLPGADAAVSVCAMRGTSITGVDVHIEGTTSFDALDATGGGISSSAGLTSVTGAVIQQKTLAGLSAWGPLIALPFAGLKTVAAAVKGGESADLTSSAKAANSRNYGAPAASFSQAGVTASTRVSDAMGTVFSVMKVIFILLNIIEKITKKFTSDKDWASSKGENNEFGTEDVFNILSLSFHLIAWVTVFSTVTRKNLAGVPSGHFQKSIDHFSDAKGQGFGHGAKEFFSGIGTGAKGLFGMLSDWGKQCSTVSLKTEGIFVNAPEKSDFTVKLKQGNGPFAGKDDDSTDGASEGGGEKELASFEKKTTPRSGTELEEGPEMVELDSLDELDGSDDD